jgi:hypothetical protein
MYEFMNDLDVNMKRWLTKKNPMGQILDMCVLPATNVTCLHLRYNRFTSSVLFGCDTPPGPTKSPRKASTFSTPKTELKKAVDTGENERGLIQVRFLSASIW